MNTKNNKRVCAVLLAGGSGSRMKASVTKQRIDILGESILHRSARALDECPLVDEIGVVAREDELEFVKSELSDIKKLIGVSAGGNTRYESAKAGFYAFCTRPDFVAIHDAARCLATPSLIERVISAAEAHGAASAASRVSSTVKHFDGEMITGTQSRDGLVLAQTPQVFTRKLYERALVNAEENKLDVTDDNMLVEALGERVYAVISDEENPKITTQQDLKYAEFLLRERGETMVKLRVGHGYDVHKLAAGRDLILGGVKIEYEKGLLGHSDADVLVHAIMDALIGALGAGDIGRHFPDNDDKYKGISSIELLRRVKSLLDSHCAEVVNVDATLVLQAPRVAKYVAKMRECIACALECDLGCINIKATTEEHLGFTGSGEGAAAHAVALITLK